ncbi:MAG: hypothetical protein ACK42E_02590, partial [Candidatus Bipolaricaulaceae bacterium]
MRTKILCIFGVVGCAAFLAWANQPPRAQTTVVFAEPDQPVPITLQAEDPDGDTLTFELLESAHFGRLLGSPPHLVYHPLA